MFWTYHLYFFLVIILVLLCVTNIFKARIRIRPPKKKATKFELKVVKLSLFGGLFSHTNVSSSINPIFILTDKTKIDYAI